MPYGKDGKEVIPTYNMLVAGGEVSHDMANYVPYLCSHFTWSMV